MQCSFWKKLVCFCLFLLFSLPLSAPLWGRAEPQTTTPADGDVILTNKLSDMSSTDRETRLQAARFVAQLPSSYAPLLVEQLQAPLPESKFPDAALQALLWAIKAEFPNPLYPEKSPLMWLSPPGQSPADAEKVNWLESLAEVQADDFTTAAEQLQKIFPQISPPALQPLFVKVRGQVLFRVALLRALGRAGATGAFPATLPMLDFAFVRNGIFRDECGHMIRGMGVYAVADLVRASGKKGGGLQGGLRRRYAAFQLDKMNFHNPVIALESMGRNYPLRANLLHAYGEIRDGRVETLQQIVDAYTKGSAQEKEAARWALTQYVDGPPPPEPPKRKRKRPGGVQEETDTPDYLDFRNLLIPLLRKAVHEIGNKAYKTLPLGELAKTLFVHYEKQGSREQDAQVTRGFAALQNNDVETAVTLFQSVLLVNPSHPARKAMAPAFALYGEALANQGEALTQDPQKGQTLIRQALGLLRRSLLLDDLLPNARRIAARIHYLDGKQVQALGGTGLFDFQQAVAADPSYEPARIALQRLTP